MLFLLWGSTECFSGWRDDDGMLLDYDSSYNGSDDDEDDNYAGAGKEGGDGGGGICDGY